MTKGRVKRKSAQGAGGRAGRGCGERARGARGAGKKLKNLSEPKGTRPPPPKIKVVSGSGRAAQNWGITPTLRLSKVSGIVSPLVVLSCRHKYVSLCYVQ